METVQRIIHLEIFKLQSTLVDQDRCKSCSWYLRREFSLGFKSLKVEGMAGPEETIVDGGLTDNTITAIKPC